MKFMSQLEEGTVRFLFFFLTSFALFLSHCEAGADESRPSGGRMPTKDAGPDARRRTDGGRKTDGDGALGSGSSNADASDQPGNGDTQSNNDHASPAPGQWININTSVVQMNLNGREPLAGKSVEQVRTINGGRIEQIRTDPKNADVVYIATTGGGVWKTTDYTTSSPPHWKPIMESAEFLAAGGLDVDLQHPGTLYVGIGARNNSYVGQVIKTTDDGATWPHSVVLGGEHSGIHQSVTATLVRDIRVDPSASDIVLVATDVGMFRSSDGGESFNLIDFTNVDGTPTVELVTSLAYVGTTGGKSTWIASGLTGYPIPRTVDVYRSTDAGVTWRSARADGVLPTPPGVSTYYSVQIAAGGNPNPARNPVFVAIQANRVDPVTSSAMDVTVLLRSLDGGAHYSAIKGPLRSDPRFSDSSLCKTVDDILGWEGGSLVVDPSDGNRVFIGGAACTARTLNGLSANPTFLSLEKPYFDTHSSAITTMEGVVRVIDGCDGGLYSATDVFTTQDGAVQWRTETSMDTQMIHNLASGDPVHGDADVMISSLQDHGTTFSLQQGNAIHSYSVGGGDGDGCAVNKGTKGSFYWHTISDMLKLCKGISDQCLRPGQWIDAVIPFPPGDQYKAGTAIISPVQTEPSGATFLTKSRLNIWRSDENGTWTLISGSHCQKGMCRSGNFPYPIASVFASQTVAGLYGAGLYNYVKGSVGSSADPELIHTAVTSDGDSATPEWTISSPLPGTYGPRIEAYSDVWIPSVGFPTTVPAGTQPGDVYLAALDFSWPLAEGHLFITRDRGKTWNAFHGNGSGFDLPNVGICLVRYDPSDSSNNTIYVATVIGVFQTTDGGDTWHRYGTNLPNLKVTDMYVSLDGSLIRISTYGRGIWEIHTR